MKRLEEGIASWRTGTPDGFAAAQSAFRAAADAAPTFSQPWAWLALSYAYQAGLGSPARSAEARRSSMLAINRALAIDPGAPEALAAQSVLQLQDGQVPLAEVERNLMKALEREPRASILLEQAAQFHAQVGRTSAALALLDRWMEVEPDPYPIPAAARAYLLQNAGRSDEAGQAIAALLERWPRHTSIFFTAFKMRMFEGRLDLALAMLNDQDRRPVGIPAWNFELCRLQVLGLSDPARYRQEALDASLRSAAEGTGFAENAMLYLSANRELDQAFQVAEAFFFGRGFAVPSRRFTPEQGTFDNRRRRTAMLFERATAHMRSDPRFGVLTSSLGLDEYWRVSGKKPDYRA